MKLKGGASACGSATIINAISIGKGSAFAIDLKIDAEVDLSEDFDDISGMVDDTSEDPLLIETCVEKTLEFFEVEKKLGARVKTTADLPIAAGLSSSSAAANATVLATADALEEDLEARNAINIGIESAFDAGTTVTGAFDDASASFYGGGVVTDNEERKLLKKFSINPELAVLIYLPSEKSYTSEADFRRTKLISDLVEVAFEEALSGNYYGAQTLNGLLYSSVLSHDPQPALEALDAGAYSAGLSGTGPSVVAISEKKDVEKIKSRWKNQANKIIVTSPSKEGAKKENE